MNYYKQDDNAPRRWGVVAMLLYFVAMLCLLLFVSFNFEREEDIVQEGILINFGVSDKGHGAKDLAATDVVAPAAKPTPKVEDEVLTDERSEVEIPTPKPHTKPTPEEVVEQPRTVNKRALFPGRTESSDATSQGASTNPEAGNQGNLSGTPDGKAAGGGEPLVGDSYDLSGRSLVGALPKPAYQDNSSGKVVIEVVVDDRGVVTSAAYRAQGSTTNSSVLIDAARHAALRAKFSNSNELKQMGTITYIFKMD